MHSQPLRDLPNLDLTAAHLYQACWIQRMKKNGLLPKPLSVSQNWVRVLYVIQPPSNFIHFHLVALLDGDSNSSTDSKALAPDSPEQLTRKFHLRSIRAVAAYIPFIDDARTKVTNEMESMVMTGLTTLNQSLLASSLQTAHNLRILPDLVQGLVSDLAQAVEERIRGAFDLNKISKEALGKGLPRV